MNRYRPARLMTAFAATFFMYAGGALAETKIGFVDTAKLMEAAPQVKAAQAKIEAEFAPREKELTKLQQDIHALEDRQSREGSVMSESESSKLERDVLAKRRDLKRTQEEFRDDLNIRRNEVLSKLQKDILDAVIAFAKEQNFDLILSGGVAYSSDKVDVTESVLKKLKQ